MLLKGVGDKVLVGYDLGSVCSQISFCFGAEGEVQTLSSVAGEEIFGIPTVLCKREKVNQWFYGREALRYAREEQGILVENLLELAVDGEPVQLEGEAYDPVALLTLFLKRSLGLLSQVTSLDKIGAFLVTCERLDSRMIEVVGQAVAGLKLKTKQIFLQSHMESFYDYMLHQPQELWAAEAVLCDYEGNRIRVYRMERNEHTKPVAVMIGIREYPFLQMEALPEEELLRQERSSLLDREFAEIAGQVCEGHSISSVYLIGEGYSEEWMRESLRYLCRGRRVFQGSNLYSKGACCGLQERMEPSEAGKNHVLLGEDKLKANIGMNVARRGEASYCALLDAGTDWFEAKAEYEFYLTEDKAVELVISPLIGKNGKLARIVPEGLKSPVSRMKLKLFLKEENRLCVELEDLGFGEIFPPTRRVWKEELEVY